MLTALVILRTSGMLTALRINYWMRAALLIINWMHAALGY